MGSCVSRCYTGGVTPTDANAQCHSGIVTEKSVLVTESLPGPKLNHIPIEAIIASSPSFTSVAYPNPFDSSPSSASSSFSSSASANCSSFPQTPLESPVQEPSSFVAVEEKQKHEMLEMNQETLLKHVQREQTQATRRKLALARKGCFCSQAARVSETRNRFINGRGSAMMAAPAPSSRRLQRSNSVVGAAAGSRLDHVQLTNSIGRRNVAGQRTPSSKGKLKASNVKQRIPRSNQTQERAGNGSEESTAEERSFVDPLMVDINNPMISMDCFIFL